MPRLLLLEVVGRVVLPAAGRFGATGAGCWSADVFG
jgi:hypothetical protein